MALELSRTQNLFRRNIFGKPKRLDVFGQGGLRYQNIGTRLDFEFGDLAVVNSPDDQVLQKFEGNFFFGHTFQTATINNAIWNDDIQDGTGTTVISNNLLVMNSPALNDNVRVFHKFDGRQTVAGDMVFEAKVKRNAGGASAACGVGLSDGNGFATDGAFFELNTDENTWRPVVDRTARTNGNDFTIPNNTWVKFKIILTTNTAKFYVNDKHQQTITGANVPDDEDMHILFLADHEGDTSNLQVQWCKVEWGAEV